MEFTENQKKYLRTKALAEYGSALVEFELLYAPGMNIAHAVGHNKVRSVGSETYTKRWAIFLIQHAGVRKMNDPTACGGVSWREISDRVKISRSAALYILNDLIEKGLAEKHYMPDEYGKWMNFYFATEELMDSYFEYVAYIYTKSKENDINGAFRKCMAIDDLVGIPCKAKQ